MDVGVKVDCEETNTWDWALSVNPAAAVAVAGLLCLRD